MPDEDKDSKTEDASAKKKEDARKKGDVLQSKDIVAVSTLFASAFTFWFMWGHIIDELVAFFEFCTSMMSVGGVDIIVRHQELIFSNTVGTLIRIVAVPMAVTVFTSVGITLLQTKGLVTFETLKPDISKLDPIKGFKNLFSLKSLADLIKNLVKISCIFYIVYSYYTQNVLKYRLFFDLEPVQSGVVMMGDIFNLVIRVGIAFSVIAVFDFLYQAWSYEKKLRMSKQEQKEEYKQMEGDPKVKGKIKQKQMSMAMSRISNGVQQADVVVRNPTHYAVALRFKEHIDVVPIIVAAGEDELAARIIRLAERYEVPTVENVTLARTLYATGKVDHPIPYELYNVVAKLLVDVLGIGKAYRNDGKEE